MLSHLLFNGMSLTNASLPKPVQYKEPTIDADTRQKLEDLKSVRFSSGSLSSHKATALESAIRASVRDRHYKEDIDLANLDGLFASKLLYGHHGLHMATSLAEAGEAMDLPDLRGLSLDGAIASCLTWPQCRLDEGVNVLTDDWHQRVYWVNSGGGHHMARLSYLLKSSERSHTVEASVKRYVRYPDEVDAVPGISLFAMNSNTRVLEEQLFDVPFLAKYLLDTDLGISLLNPWFHSQPAASTMLIAIEESAKHSKMALRILHKAEEEGVVQSFRNWLMSFGSPMLDVA